MKKILLYTLSMLFWVSLCVSCENFDVPEAKKYEGNTSTRIWGNASHSAFTSLVKYNGNFYCAFREAETHAGYGGKVTIIKSTDGVKWEAVRTFKLESPNATTPDVTFNGKQNMVIPYSSDFDYETTDGFTVTANLNMTSGSNVLIFSNRNGGNGFEMGHKTGIIYCDLGLPYIRFSQNPGIFTYDTWHHMAMVYDGENQRFRLYQDGAECTTGVYPAGSSINGQANTFGNDITVFSKAPNHKTNPAGYSGYSIGRIMNIRFWDKALTEDEIIADQTASVSAETRDLIAGYDFSVRESRNDTVIIPDVTGRHPAYLRNFTMDDFEPPTDQRDPKLIVTSDNKLVMICDGDFYKNGKITKRRPYMATSSDGVTFTALEEVDVFYPTPDVISSAATHWIWSPVYHKGVAYGVDYVGGKMVLFASDDDCVSFKPVYSFNEEEIGEKATEVALVFDKSDKLYAFVRHDGNTGYIGKSSAPYTEWSFSDLGYRVEGQNVIMLDDSHFIVGTRKFVENEEDGSIEKSMAVYVTDMDGKIQKSFDFPSSGDCSYPGLVLDNEYLWISYYATHEGISSIYLAKLPVGELK